MKFSGVDCLKIIMVGGYLYGETGDINMVKNLSNSLSSSHNEIYHFPFLPLINRPDHKTSYNVLGKKLSWSIVCACIVNSVKWLKLIYPFLKKSFRGISYYFITLYYYILMNFNIQSLNPDLIHVHGISIESFSVIMAAMKNSIPLVVTIHLFSSEGIPNYYDKSVEYHLINILNENDITFNVVSNSVKENISETLGDDAKFINVIPNGVDLFKFRHISGKKNLRSKYDIPENKIVCIQVGTLNKRKNHISFLRAINKMSPDLKNKILYLIIGEGEEKKTLLHFIEEKNLKNQVIFKGKIPNEKLAELYSLSDFMILPSLSEGLPLVFLESMACGVPIITFKDLEGVDEVFNNESIELIQSRSIHSIIDSIDSAINREWNRKNIRSQVENRSWEYVSSEYLKLYEISTNKERSSK